jgi:hypothetical protein
MSLDKFVKTEKKQDGGKELQKPAAKPAAVKSEKPQKPAKKVLAKSKAKPAPIKDETDEMADQPRAEADQVEVTGEEVTAPRESALKTMGLVKYALACPACKYKKELHVSGEPKPHQLLCKKCGGTMKAGKKV